MDMLVKLYEVEADPALEAKLLSEGIRIKKGIGPDLHLILDFVRTNFSEGWTSEATVGVIRDHCWIAVKDKKVVGFACYDATRLNFFGPTGVLEELRGKGVGRALLLRSLLSMREMGYRYAIIGWAGPEKFYEKNCGAVVIPGSIPGSYSDMVSVEM